MFWVNQSYACLGAITGNPPHINKAHLVFPKLFHNRVNTDTILFLLFCEVIVINTRHFKMREILFAVLVTGAICASIHKENESRQKRNAVNIDDYLVKFGYMEPIDKDSSKSGTRHDSASRSAAIREFQRFNGMEVTGEVDEVTYNKMQQPRCGVRDIPEKQGNGPLEFNAPGRKWRKNLVSWRMKKSGISDKLPEKTQREAMQNALGHWSKVTPLQFTETSNTPDMEIMFASGNHGDGIQSSFDGSGGILAHAYFPENGYLDGDTHFDEDERWVYHNNRGTELETVAAHEFGHALGLSHSDNPSALMAPFYRGYIPNTMLHDDDIQGIQSLYGGPIAKPTTKSTTTTTTTTTPRPTTSTTTPRPVTTKSTTTRSPATTKPTTPRSRTTTGNICDLDRFDAVSLGPDGSTYVFSGGLVYKIGSEGMVDGFPRAIGDIYTGSEPAPKSVKAAVYIRAWGYTFLFSKTEPKVYRYLGFNLDRVSTIPNIEFGSALTITNGAHQQIYMLGTHYFWELNQYTLHLAPGFPLPISRYWANIPRHTSSSIEWKDGFLYMFSHNRKYSRVDPYRRTTLPGYPGKAAAKWLSHLCSDPRA